MDELSDEIVFFFSTFLLPTELVNLALACKRFGSRDGRCWTIHTPVPSCSGIDDIIWLDGMDGMDEMDGAKCTQCTQCTQCTKRKQCTQCTQCSTTKIPQVEKHSSGELKPVSTEKRRAWSLIEEAARQRITSTQTEEEKRCLAWTNGGSISWMHTYHQLRLLRLPLHFRYFLPGRNQSNTPTSPTTTTMTTTTTTIRTPPTPPTSENPTFIPAIIPTTNLNFQGSGTAISTHIMKSGRHYASFTIQEEGPRPMRIGVVRPLPPSFESHDSKTFDPSTSVVYDYYCRKQKESLTPIYDSHFRGMGNGQRQGQTNNKNNTNSKNNKYNNNNEKTDSSEINFEFSGDIHCCMYDFRTGGFVPVEYLHLMRHTPLTWDGSQRTREGHATIGLLLDLDVGTLAVYKNGRRLGVMRHRLAGSYCWGVVVDTAYEGLRTEVVVERGVAPEG